MKDFLGNQLEPGDTIVYIHRSTPSHSHFQFAKVASMSESGRVYLERIEGRVKAWTYPDKVMKVTQ